MSLHRTLVARYLQRRELGRTASLGFDVAGYLTSRGKRLSPGNAKRAETALEKRVDKIEDQHEDMEKGSEKMKEKLRRHLQNLERELRLIREALA